MFMCAAVLSIIYCDVPSCTAVPPRLLTYLMNTILPQYTDVAGVTILLT